MTQPTISAERIEEMLAELGQYSHIEQASFGVPIFELRSILTELSALRAQAQGSDAVALAGIVAAADRWNEQQDKAAFDGLSSAIDVARATIASTPVQAQPQGVAVKALELIARLVSENIHDNGTDINRMLVNGEWHTGPVVDAAFRIIKGLGKIATNALATPPAPVDGWGDPQEIERVEAEVKTLLDDPVDAPTHRHVKRGTEYVLLGIGKMQTQDWYEQGHDIMNRLVYETADMAEVAIYRSVNDGSLWARPREEFEDGRFEALTASRAAVAQEGK